MDGNYFSGSIPESISDLSSIMTINISYNELSGEIPELICNLGFDWGQWGNGVYNGISNNNLCPPYPECIGEGNIGYQNTLECIECTLGDINDDSSLNILDLVSISNLILDNGYDECGDTNSDGELNILDLVTLVNIILSN